MDTEKQPYLYHFMPIHKFIDFILNKALIFTSLLYMEDKFDGISSEDASILHQINQQQKIFDQDDFFKRISFGAPNVNNIFDNIIISVNVHFVAVFVILKNQKSQ